MLVLSQLKSDLIAVLADGNSQAALDYQTNGDVTQISQGKVVLGFNFLNLKVTDHLGLIKQTPELIDQLNQLIKTAGFDQQLAIDQSKRFVVAYVQTLSDHPDSDHLKIATLDLGNQQSTTVVSGSPNIQENIKVVAVRPGAMMPSGQIIFPGQLRGVDSDGMIASARELKIKNAPNKPGALILPDDWSQAVGEEFDFEEGDKIYGR